MCEKKMQNDELIRNLSRQFGSYRAEWSGDDLYRHFTTPCYFASLGEFKACVLQGGRGTGKTTALKGLSYQGQYKIHGEDIRKFDECVRNIGLYRRVDTNHVRAFRGAGLDPSTWGKLFGHFFNLVIVLDVIEFLIWHQELRGDESVIDSGELKRVFKMLFSKEVDFSNYNEFCRQLREELYNFQCVVNNVASYGNCLPFLSFIGEPILYFMKAVRKLDQFNDVRFFLILDEYENFEDYQQFIINTQIKHASEIYTFKIGVREQGWVGKHTLNDEETLNDPADYVLLDINQSFEEGPSFKEFAKEVCQKRFEMALGVDFHFDVEKALADLSDEEEAELLGVGNSKMVAKFNGISKEVREAIGDIPNLYKYIIAVWALTHKRTVEEEALWVVKDRVKWDTRYNNYKYHMLFRIKRGPGSGSLQKYYCGFDTFIKLADNNIRFLMQLIYMTFEAHLVEHDISEPVDPKLQTKVTRRIGEKNLAQLEGECREGSSIVRMLFGLGQILEYLAKADNSSVEVNQFVIDGLDEDPEMKALVNSAIRHLALVRAPGDKRDGYETKSYEYNIHPIFSPFFTYSYRRKRKTHIGIEDFRGLTINPKQYVRIFLDKRKAHVDDAPATEQLDLGLQ